MNQTPYWRKIGWRLNYQILRQPYPNPNDTIYSTPSVQTGRETDSLSKLGAYNKLMYGTNLWLQFAANIWQINTDWIRWICLLTLLLREQENKLHTREKEAVLIKLPSDYNRAYSWKGRWLVHAARHRLESFQRDYFYSCSRRLLTKAVHVAKVRVGFLVFGGGLVIMANSEWNFCDYTNAKMMNDGRCLRSRRSIPSREPVRCDSAPAMCQSQPNKQKEE